MLRLFDYRLPHGRGSVGIPSRAPAAHSQTTGSRARRPLEDDPNWKFPGRRALENIGSKKTGRVARQPAVLMLCVACALVLHAEPADWI